MAERTLTAGERKAEAMKQLIWSRLKAGDVRVVKPGLTPLEREMVYSAASWCTGFAGLHRPGHVRPAHRGGRGRGHKLAHPGAEAAAADRVT